MVFNIDSSIELTDWLRSSTWDLPTDPEAFLWAIGGVENLDHFLQLPAAKAMPDSLKVAIHGVQVAKKFWDTEEVEKHQWGHHDQSTHAPHHIAGVPEGIDLEGKRLTDASRMELMKLGIKFQDVDRRTKTQILEEVRAKFGELSTPSILEARTTSNPTPQQLEIRKFIDEKYASNKEYMDAKKALEENFLFKDAMNLHDANGVRLGDKVFSREYGESPESYLQRKMAWYGDGNLNPMAFEQKSDFLSKKIDDKLKDVRTTPEEAIRVATDDFKTFASKADLVVILPQERLGEVLADGRYKTVHETGRSQGVDGEANQQYLDNRLVYENAAYGYGDSTPITSRPVSGMIVGQGGYPYDSHPIYGGSKPAEIVLKPEVRERTTWTNGDSLNTFATGKTFESTIMPANQLSKKASIYRKGMGENYFDSKDFATSSLIEIQVHGGVKVSDIGKVRFYTPPSKAVAARLERAGIPYETVELPKG